MIVNYRNLGTVLVLLVGCAKGGAATSDASGSGGSDGNGSGIDGNTSCGESCDADGDGVLDPNDQCPNTPAGVPVNFVGCADSQLMPTLHPTFPAYGLTFTSAGNPGRAGGLTWTYSGIQRGQLFHIYWVICDDPATPCGVSLDGAIDAPAENWTYSAVDSNAAAGKVAFTNTTHILLADTTAPQLTGRLTVIITDSADVPIPFKDVAALMVPPRDAKYGSEITGTGFKVVAITEVQDTAGSAWMPYLDYYDAASTPDTGATAASSFGGSFYDK